MGIEPTSPAWEAGVIAIIRRPQSALFYTGSRGLGKRRGRHEQACDEVRHRSSMWRSHCPPAMNEGRKRIVTRLEDGDRGERSRRSRAPGPATPASALKAVLEAGV
jgi:hypothetical protein